MLNQRAQILLDLDTKNLLMQAASTMNVSFSEAVRQAANYTYKTKKLHHAKPSKKSQQLIAEITALRKSIKPTNLTVSEIKAMAHYGHKY